jgi:type IV pilus assembly protein PilW
MRAVISRKRPARRPPTAGLSLVELMVGITVGLIVVAGASFVAVNQIGDNRRLLLETQVQQDLRAATDQIARDVRRAGYWGAAEAGLWQGDNPALAVNPYVAVAPAAASAPIAEVGFAYSRDPAGAEDGAVDDDAERFGFKLEDGAIKMLLGGTWQMLTDTNVLEVTAFAVTAQPQTVRQTCYRECAGGGTACWPTETVRTLTIDIAGRAVSDPSVERSVREVVRLRNDATAGACPA